MVTHRVATINSGHSQRCVELRWLSGRRIAQYARRGLESCSRNIYLFVLLSLSLRFSRFSTYSIKSHEKLWNCR